MIAYGVYITKNVSDLQYDIEVKGHDQIFLKSV